MITKEMIRLGIKERLITFEIDPNMEAGTVCRIGDSWFYFGGQTAEEMNPDEFLKNVPDGDIIQEIYDVLNEFSKYDETKDEYDYYESILLYRNGYSS